jgi:cytochrome c-type biogenesis protein CcmH
MTARGRGMAAGLVGLVLTLFLLAPAGAVEPNERLADPALEARARTLSQILRCLVCQNQSIDDSKADLAGDLRRVVRQRLLDGDSDERVLEYVVARYGDFVLLKPPLKPTTYALWFGPPIILVLAGGAIVLYFRRRRIGAMAELDPLSADERGRLAAAMKDENAS